MRCVVVIRCTSRWTHWNAHLKAGPVNDSRTLRDLVGLAQHRHDASARELARRAQDRGYRITATTLSAILAGTYKSRPSRETLQAIAWLAGVHEDEAFTAAGLPVPGPPFADELPPGVDNLSPRKRRAVIDLLRVLIEDEERDGDDRDAAPTRQAAESAAVSEPDTAADGRPDAQSSEGPRKHWTSVTEQDIAAGAGLPLAPAHGRKKRTTDRTKRRHS